MPLWLAGDPLVLASRSAARRMLLEAAGVPIELRPADIDERSVEADAASTDPAVVAAHLADAKASVASRSFPGRLVLGADQTLALEGRRFAKPTDRTTARAQLRALSGSTHQLHSAIAFVQNSSVLFQHGEVARLTMRPLSDRFIDLYLDAVGTAAMTSVGAYQIEGPGIQLFERIEGDYFTILGLPLLAALDFLRQSRCLAS
jgi:septum formation protein